MKNYALILLLLSALTAQAQVFMPAFENTANLAMGGATVGWREPVNGINNPAQLGFAPRLGVLAWSAIPYSIGGWQSHGFQAFTRLPGRSGVGLDILHSGIEGYTEQRFQAGYGRQLSDKLALGGTVMGMRVSADEYGSRTALSFAVGVTAQVLPSVSLGAMVQNPVPQKIDSSTIANLLKIGVAWQPSATFVLSAGVDKDLERPVQLRAGAEYRPNNTIRLRLGVRNAPARMAFGAGFALKNGIRIDFCSEWHPVLGLTPGGMVGWIL
jgi:hypothetical protein